MIKQLNLDVLVCPFCWQDYFLGLNGTVDGCDPCLTVIRNPVDHTIIEEGESVVVEVEA
jgi:hypothetical protein